jgi:transcriptional regulator with XRE-family HTH domain
MAGRTNWRELRSRSIEGRPGADKRVNAYKRLMELDTQLSKLRELRGASQAALADSLAVSQPNVSRIEREDDLRVSTLGRYVEALGGELEIRAHFPDAVIELRGGELPAADVDVIDMGGEDERVLVQAKDAPPRRTKSKPRVKS